MKNVWNFCPHRLRRIFWKYIVSAWYMNVPFFMIYVKEMRQSLIYFEEEVFVINIWVLYYYCLSWPKGCCCIYGILNKFTDFFIKLATSTSTLNFIKISVKIVTEFLWMQLRVYLNSFIGSFCNSFCRLFLLNSWLSFGFKI